MASPGGPPPRILSSPRRTRPWLRKALLVSVAVGLGLFVFGMALQSVSGLEGLGGTLVLAGLLVAAGGFWASYYAGPS